LRKDLYGPFWVVGGWGRGLLGRGAVAGVGGVDPTGHLPRTPRQAGAATRSRPQLFYAGGVAESRRQVAGRAGVGARGSRRGRGRAVGEGWEALCALGPSARRRGISGWRAELWGWWGEAPRHRSTGTWRRASGFEWRDLCAANSRPIAQGVDCVDGWAQDGLGSQCQWGAVACLWAACDAVLGPVD